MGDRALSKQHITNLEGDAYFAQLELKAGTDALKEELRLRRQLHEATMDLLKLEYGSIQIGKPQKTRYKTQAQLERQGYVGIYTC